MRTKKFKTLNGLCKSLDCGVLSYDNFVSGRAIFLSKKGYGQWCAFELDSKARREFAEGIAKVLWARPDEEKVRAVLNYSGKNYGIFRRLWYDARYKRKNFEYCAGQDYDAEIRTVRKLILRGY